MKDTAESKRSKPPLPPAPPIYVLVVKPFPQEDDPQGIRRLRMALKRLLRNHGLRVLQCTPEVDKGAA